MVYFYSEADKTLSLFSDTGENLIIDSTANNFDFVFKKVVDGSISFENAKRCVDAFVGLDRVYKDGVETIEVTHDSCGVLYINKTPVPSNVSAAYVNSKKLLGFWYIKPLFNFLKNKESIENVDCVSNGKFLNTYSKEAKYCINPNLTCQFFNTFLNGRDAESVKKFANNEKVLQKYVNVFEEFFKCKLTDNGTAAIKNNFLNERKTDTVLFTLAEEDMFLRT